MCLCKIRKTEIPQSLWESTPGESSKLSWIFVLCNFFVCVPKIFLVLGGIQCLGSMGIFVPIDRKYDGRDLSLLIEAFFLSPQQRSCLFTAVALGGEKILLCDKTDRLKCGFIPE